MAYKGLEGVSGVKETYSFKQRLGNFGDGVKSTAAKIGDRAGYLVVIKGGVDAVRGYIAMNPVMLGIGIAEAAVGGAIVLRNGQLRVKVNSLQSDISRLEDQIRHEYNKTPVTENPNLLQRMAETVGERTEFLDDVKPIELAETGVKKGYEATRQAGSYVVDKGKGLGERIGGFFGGLRDRFRGEEGDPSESGSYETVEPTYDSNTELTPEIIEADFDPSSLPKSDDDDDKSE